MCVCLLQPGTRGHTIILPAFEPLAANYKIAYRMQANEVSHLHPRNMQKKEHLPGALLNLKIVALTSNHTEAPRLQCHIVSQKAWTFYA